MLVLCGHVRWSWALLGVALQGLSQGTDFVLLAVALDAAHFSEDAL